MEKLIEEEMKKREEIVNTFDKNYLLEAGAGAGKTSIIVERVINHILYGNVEPRNIVAITFTKAASLELAQRIERMALDYLSKEEYSFAKDKLERVEEIFTGTIHSFCELLLREMPFEAGLTPGYEIIEDSESFYKEIWYEFLRDEEELNRDIIERLNRFNIDYRDLDTSAFVAMDNPDIDFVGFEKDSSLEEIIEKFKNIDTKNLDPDIIKKNSNLGKFSSGIIEDKGELQDHVDDILSEFAKVGHDEDIGVKLIYKKDLESERAEATIEYLKDLLDIYKDLNANMYNLSTEFVNRVVDYKDKYYTNSLTFNDLLFRASNLIKSSAKARKHFKDKFKYFYIDETQDTDPMQAELLLLMSHNGDREEIDSIEDVIPRDGSLFIVGDPKQSIYRFRRADITIYESVKEIISQHGEVVYLDINFRSSDSICSWVEKSFRDRDDGFAFTKTATRVQAGFERILSLWKDKDEREDKLSGVYGYDYQEDMGSSEEEYIAALVDDMIKNQTIDEKQGRTEIVRRPIENKDIMILTKSNAETGRYLNALKARNISALLAGEKRLSDNREVLNLSLILDFLTDPKDKVKFVAALRNSFYIEFETINYLFKRIHKLKEYKKDKEDKEKILIEDIIRVIDHPHLKEVFFHLEEMFKNFDRMRPITFVETIIKNRVGVYNTYKNYNETEERDADSALVQTLELLKSRNPISLYDINVELKEIVNEKVNYELPINMSFAQNAVRIMNIHKAKGLESNIVILVGSDKRRTTGSDSHYVEKKEDKNLGYIAYKRSLLINGPDQEARKDREREFKDAEIDRLIYVAATRTKSVLITPSLEEEKMFLAPISLDIPRIISVEDFKEKTNEEKEDFRKVEEVKITKELLIKEEVSIESYEKASPSNFDKYTDDSGILGLVSDRSTPRGIEYGNMVHDALEILLKDISDIDGILKKDIDYAVRKSIMDRLQRIELNQEELDKLYPENDFKLYKGIQNTETLEIVEGQVEEHLNKNLQKIVTSFLNNKDIRDEFKNIKDIFVEFPFTSNLDLSSIDESYRDKNVIVNGFIDLLILTKDNNFVIIDYKTDRVPEDLAGEIFKSRYIKQLNIYKMLLEEVFLSKGMEVEKLLIYSTYLDEIIPIEKIYSL